MSSQGVGKSSVGQGVEQNFKVLYPFNVGTHQ